MIVLGVGIFFLLAAVVLVILAVRSEPKREKAPKAPSRPASTEVVFFNRVVNIMVGGKSFGTLTQLSLPGDTPEVWNVDAAPPGSSAADLHYTRQIVGTRAEAEEWARSVVQDLAARYETTFVHESSTVGA